jgi:hypothetical protein
MPESVYRIGLGTVVGPPETEKVHRIGLGAVVDTSGAPDTPLASRTYLASVASLVTKRANVAVRLASVATVYKFYAPPRVALGSVASLVTYFDNSAQFNLSEYPDVVSFEITTMAIPYSGAAGPAGIAHCRSLEIPFEDRTIVVPPRVRRSRQVRGPNEVTDD